ncbi:hypothetical protein ACFFRR_002778 [Megaselia abdita]
MTFIFIPDTVKNVEKFYLTTYTKVTRKSGGIIQSSRFKINQHQLKKKKNAIINFENSNYFPSFFGPIYKIHLFQNKIFKKKTTQKNKNIKTQQFSFLFTLI